MSQQGTVTQEAPEAQKSFATFDDIHTHGGVDSSPEEIQANTCQSCFIVFPATGTCGNCD